MYIQVSTQPPPPHHNHFTALFPGPSGWAGARRELLDFTVQGKINRGIHSDHPAGCHSIWTNQCPPPPSPHIFYRLDALPAAQPTASKHWRQSGIDTKLHTINYLLSYFMDNTYVNVERSSMDILSQMSTEQYSVWSMQKAMQDKFICMMHKIKTKQQQHQQQQQF